MAQGNRSVWAVCFIGGILAATGAVSADVPRLIHYQGKLRTAAGVAVNDTVSLRFRLYGHSTQAAPVLLDETHGSVAVSNGLFSAMIGGETAGGVPDSAFDSPSVYIGIEINGGDELAPRTPLVSTAYALSARSAEQLVKPGGAQPAVQVDLNGNVGVGTAAPGEKLEVAGNIKLGGASPTFKISNVAAPTADDDVATKAYVDASGGPAYEECYGACAGDNNATCNAGYTRVFLFSAGTGCSFENTYLPAAGGLWYTAAAEGGSCGTYNSNNEELYGPGSAKPIGAVNCCSYDGGCNCNMGRASSCAVCCK